MTGQARVRESIRTAMAELAANFDSPTDITAILETVTAQAVELIDSVDVADVLLVDAERYRSLAPTAEIAAVLDSIQLELKEGPCLDAAVSDAAVVCPDLSAEPRWPSFAAAAVTAGVSAMMSYHLYSHPAKRGAPAGRGALNLFSHNPVDYTVEEQAIAAMLATHAATALLAADRQTQFESALASRDVIGQAKGMLMERFKIDAVRAFALMTQLSQDNNVKLRTIAQQIVETK